MAERSAWSTPAPVSIASAPSVGVMPTRVDEVLGEAAETVAAHLAVGAVGVDDYHPRGSDIGVLGNQDAVRTDAEMPVADTRRERRPVNLVEVRILAEGVDQQEIVPCALDFEKRN